MADINDELFDALKEITDRFERSMILSGTDPEFAAISVERQRAALAAVERRETVKP